MEGHNNHYIAGDIYIYEESKIYLEKYIFKVVFFSI